MKISFEHFASGENLYSKTVAPVCQKYGLTYMEFTILMFLYNHPQYDTATQIVKIRRLTKSHVSISIRSLEQRGLLVCAFQGHDRRTVHLKLTDAAQCITSDGCAAQKAFSQTVFSGFSPEEIELLTHYLKRIDQNIEAQNRKETGE